MKMLEIINACRIVAGKAGMNESAWRHSYRWDDNIKMNVMELDCGNSDMVHLAYGKDHLWTSVNMVLKLGFH
jgi:hypothetical protein